MPRQRRELTIPADTFIARIAWFDYHGRHREAAVLRDLAAWFTPPYRVDEADVQAHVAELQRQADKLPRLD